MKEPLNPTAPLLLVDDEDSWLNSLSFMLEFSAGFNNIILARTVGRSWVFSPASRLR
jgi:hypothetical protein